MKSAGDAPRFIDVFELARVAATVQGSLPLARMARLRPSLAVSDGDLAFAYRGRTDERGRPAGQLTFRGQVAQTCDRCGAPVVHELAGETHYYFVRTEAELGRIPVDESEEEPLLGSPRFDLCELLEDEAILALPMSPRHEDCEAGPAGRAAPAAQPEGHDDARPHPFAALAQLRSRRQ